MRILHVSTFDSGGAFQAAYRLHLSLLREGVVSKMLVLSKKRDDLEEVYSFFDNQTFLSKVIHSIKYRYWKWRTQKLLRSKPEVQFSFHLSPYDILNHSLAKESDVVNLHWVAHFLDYPSFFKENSKPLVWTLHDLNPFLGGFHYLMYFTAVAAHFSQLDEWIKKEKQTSLKDRPRLQIVSPSIWLKELSSKSSLFAPFQHHHIPYGVDLQIYQPRENEVRKEMGLPMDKKLVLFVADSLQDQRKGMEYLVEMFQKYKWEDCCLVTVGQGELPPLPLPVISLGFIMEEVRMAKVYASVDVFVIASLEDNFPNTVLESLACGIPVVGFEVGGIKDVVQNGVNGFLSEIGDIECMVKNIKLIIEDKDLRRKLQKGARESALLYSFSSQASQYKALYNRMIH